MIDGISFANQEWWIPVCMGTVILYACFLWKEWLERQRGKMLLNSIVAFVSLLALALIVLEPMREVEINDRQGLLLTDGYDEAKKDSLIELYPEITVLDYHPERSIRTELDLLTSVFVLGNGMKAFDFWQLKNLPTVFVPNEITTGISKLKYSKSLVLGDEMGVSGIYANPPQRTFLVLEDPAGNGLDSIRLETNSKVGFSLRTNPKVSGNYKYVLTEKDSTGVVKKTEPLPVQISEKNTLRVLILNDFPTFETKYLKNFLADNGHEVIVRSQLTKGKYKFEYFNSKRIPIYQITDEILNDFNLVIVDADTYYGFGTTVKKRIEKHITANGLGLFLQPTNVLFRRNANSSYFHFSSDGVHETTLGNSKSILEKYPYVFDQEFAQQPIALGASIPIAAYKQFGLGRVATMTVQNSYQLVLDGNENEYERFWTQLLDRTMNQGEAAVEWEAVTAFPRINEPFDFTLRTNLDDFKVMKEDSSSVGMIQNSQISTLYSGTTYPKTVGWNALIIASDSAANFSFYVMDSTDWKSLEISKSISANQREFQKAINKNRTVLVDRPISMLWFYIPFLFGIGWLWLVPKLFGELAN